MRLVFQRKDRLGFSAAKYGTSYEEYGQSHAPNNPSYVCCFGITLIHLVYSCNVVDSPIELLKEYGCGFWTGHSGFLVPSV